MEETMSMNLDYVKQVIASSPIIVYPDPDKQYHPFTDSSKHSLGGILIQYQEQVKRDETILNLPYIITYKIGAFQSFEKNWSALTKEAYSIYVSFHKMVFYLRDTHVKIRCGHAPLHKFIYSVTKNDKGNNW